MGLRGLAGRPLSAEERAEVALARGHPLDDLGRTMTRALSLASELGLPDAASSALILDELERRVWKLPS